ncbi:hypothetical protein, partial [Mesorhizobium sp.]|uniref:hypothetical protein n=1 Tax=Mesorhizobium sp. TaxID=1871066 RepID=UPI00257A0A7B
GAHQQTLESGFRLKHGCSTVSALRADPPSPTREEGKSTLLPPRLQTLVDNVQENYRTVSGGGAPSG